MGTSNPGEGAHRLRITLIRSPIGVPKKRRQVLRGLGLRRMLQTVTHPDTNQVRGLIDKVRHLIEVTHHET
jgi:large subunit ribosomal protein L30